MSTSCSASAMDPPSRIDDPAEIERTYPRQARTPFNVTGHPALATMSGLSSSGLPLSVQFVSWQLEGDRTDFARLAAVAQRVCKPGVVLHVIDARPHIDEGRNIGCAVRSLTRSPLQRMKGGPAITSSPVSIVEEPQQVGYEFKNRATTRAMRRVPDGRAVERGRQFHGRSSSIRWAGCSAIRARTSASQACGSTSFNLAVTIRL
jgi:hypothetical protein